ncbi:MAG: hypothetical protein MK052_00110 [Alphaproteobacteria bacterium]|nr:hypothetical protein [Alphaproteobacteria bacterium]
MQNIQNMSPAERNAMLDDVMKNTDAMESCIAEFGGMNALKDLQTYGEAHKKQVADLCKKDKRKQAQAYAQDASQEMLKDPRVVKLRDCSRMALQNMPELAALVETGGLSSDKHVCD